MAQYTEQGFRGSPILCPRPKANFWQCLNSCWEERLAWGLWALEWVWLCRPGAAPLRVRPCELQPGFCSAPLQWDTQPARRASRLSAPVSRFTFRSTKRVEFPQVFWKSALLQLSVGQVPSRFCKRAYRGKPVGPSRRRKGAWLWFKRAFIALCPKPSVARSGTTPAVERDEMLLLNVTRVFAFLSFPYS